MQRVRLFGATCLGLLVFGLSLNVAQADDSFDIKSETLNVEDESFDIKLEKTPTFFKSLKLKEEDKASALYFNDPYYKKQSFFARIRAEAAYTLLYATAPTSQAKIGIIDQGAIDSSNPELAGKILAGSDFGSNINHGQFVLGIMAASSNNGFGISGVAGVYSEFLYKSLPMVDRKPNPALIAQYIREFGRLGFDAVNLSFAIERECTTRNPDGGNCYHAIVASSVVRAAILETALEYKTIFVVSAGNSGQPLPAYTTPENGVLVVGAATKNLDIADYTNNGPGVDLYVTEQGIYGLSKKSVSSPQTGTSFTAPVVTAAVAQVSRYLKNNGVQMSAGAVARLVISTSQFESSLTKRNSSGRHLDFGKLAEEAQKLVQSRR